MTFEYGGKLINLLDTPGHRDFAEDTYRTLTAVDSVVLVIDCVKGVEAQTERLMEVCRMRNTPGDRLHQQAGPGRSRSLRSAWTNWRRSSRSRCGP